MTILKKCLVIGFEIVDFTTFFEENVLNFGSKKTMKYNFLKIPNDDNFDFIGATWIFNRDLLNPYRKRKGHFAPVFNVLIVMGEQ